MRATATSVPPSASPRDRSRAASPAASASCAPRSREAREKRKEREEIREPARPEDVTRMPPHDEERLAELLRALPPAPEAWIKAAQELPLARLELDEIV